MLNWNFVTALDVIFNSFPTCHIGRQLERIIKVKRRTRRKKSYTYKWGSPGLTLEFYPGLPDEEEEMEARLIGREQAAALHGIPTWVVRFGQHKHKNLTPPCTFKWKINPGFWLAATFPSSCPCCFQERCSVLFSRCLNPLSRHKQLEVSSLSQGLCCSIGMEQTPQGPPDLLEDCFTSLQSPQEWFLTQRQRRQSQR